MVTDKSSSSGSDFVFLVLHTLQFQCLDYLYISLMKYATIMNLHKFQRLGINATSQYL